MTEENNDKTVTFEFDPELMEVESGFAILVGEDENGSPMTGYTAFGDLTPQHVIGLLTATLDQIRWEHVDIGHKGMLEVLGFSDESEGLNG